MTKTCKEENANMENNPVFKTRLDSNKLVSASLFSQKRKGKFGDFTSNSVSLQIAYPSGKSIVNKRITILERNLDAVIENLLSVKTHLKA
jgi:hypothetical protein